MRHKFVPIFIFSAGVLLIFTGVVKLLSSFGSARILETLDPVFHISFRTLFILAAVLEIGVGIFCLRPRDRKVQSGVVLFLAVNFLLYRFGVAWQGYGSSCRCLGNLTDELHLPPAAADLVMKIALGYLLAGGALCLFWLRQSHRGTAIPVAA